MVNKTHCFGSQHRYQSLRFSWVWLFAAKIASKQSFLLLDKTIRVYKEPEPPTTKEFKIYPLRCHEIWRRNMKHTSRKQRQSSAVAVCYHGSWTNVPRESSQMNTNNDYYYLDVPGSSEMVSKWVITYWYMVYIGIITHWSESFTSTSWHIPVDPWYLPHRILCTKFPFGTSLEKPLLFS